MNIITDKDIITVRYDVDNPKLIGLVKKAKANRKWDILDYKWKLLPTFIDRGRPEDLMMVKVSFIHKKTSATKELKLYLSIPTYETTIVPILKLYKGTEIVGIGIDDLDIDGFFDEE